MVGRIERLRRIVVLLLAVAAGGCSSGVGAQEWGDHRPVVSPDGLTLAFMSNRSGVWSVYTMPLDGSAPPERVSNDPDGEWYADWSPDGHQLTYYRTRGESSALYTFAVATRQERALGPADGRAGPRWAPDGHVILHRCRDRGICALTATGIDLGTAFGLDGEYHDPALSPDGRRIAFVARDDEGFEDAFVRTLDGSGDLRVTDDPGRTFGLDWSPDGTSLAYNTEVDGNTDVYVVEVESGRHRRLTTDSATDHLPRWAPDGSYLVFTSERTGAERIYRIRPDGSELTRIETDPPSPPLPSRSDTRGR